MNYRKKIEHFFEQTLDFIYPIRNGSLHEGSEDYRGIEYALLAILIANIEESDIDLEKTAKDFVNQLPIIKSILDKDIEAIYNGDPAAKNHNEIIIAYPGFYAVAAYRIAHYLYELGVPLIPRVITSHAHSYTSIDIHPAAEIGEYLCIDHGSGVVIGETAVIGNHVKIYQGVTLGALSIYDKEMPGKRHPTIEDHVILYAQATILGGNTVIGANCIIGGNVWLTDSVPANSKIYYKQNDNIIINSNLAVPQS